MRKIPVLLVAAAAAFTVPAGAQTFAYDNNPKVDAASVTSYQTNFDDLNGMFVTATFGGGGTCSGTWGSLVPGILSGVSCTNGSNFFSLGGFSFTDTYFTPWGLVASNLAKFTVDAVPGNAVFDIVAHDEVTPGSNIGQEFDYACAGVFPLCYLDGNDYWGTTVKYSEPTRIGGVLSHPADTPPITDIWGEMTVKFDHNFDTKGVEGKCEDIREAHINGCNFVEFYQDMDNVEGGDFGTPQSTVPEPGTLAMLATGLVGLAGVGRRRRRNA